MAMDKGSILERLAEIEKTGRLEGIEIEFWQGGGLPPPYYRSDQLRLMTVEGQEILEFASLKWDSHFDPSNLLEKWTLAVDPKDLRKVAGLLKSTHVFTAQYPEETNPGVADIFSYEILVTAEGRQGKKIYYRKLPEQLMPLQAAFDKLIELTRKHGRKGIYHQGKEIKQ